MSKILVVDDDEDVRRMLAARLEASGYEVAQAFDCISTMNAARQEAPDLILLDLGLPAGDGFLLMEQLKANSCTSSIPVIVLTGRDAEGNQERAYETGAADFFQKPFNTSWLLRAINEALAQPVSENLVRRRPSACKAVQSGLDSATPAMLSGTARGSRPRRIPPASPNYSQ